MVLLKFILKAHIIRSHSAEDLRVEIFIICVYKKMQNIKRSAEHSKKHLSEKKRNFWNFIQKKINKSETW